MNAVPTHARKLRMQPDAVFTDSIECGQYEVIKLIAYSHNDHDDTKIISDALYQTEFYH